MESTVNLNTVVSLFAGPHDGLYLRIDPKVNEFIWEGEVYTKICREQPHVLVHARSVAMTILKQQQWDIHECYAKYEQWFFSIAPESMSKEQLSEVSSEIDLFLCFNAVVALGQDITEVFPELSAP